MEARIVQQDKKIAELEKKISEQDEKIAEIIRNMELIQSMVTVHNSGSKACSGGNTAKPKLNLKKHI